MQEHHRSILDFVTDLANFLDNLHLTNLDRIRLNTSLPESPDDPQTDFIIRGMKHEKDLLMECLDQTVGEVQHLVEALPRPRPPMTPRPCFAAAPWADPGGWAGGSGGASAVG